MGDLTANLSRHEFACKCGCGFDSIDVQTLFLVQRVRDHFGAPVRVSSGCRCPDHNHAVGGAKRSQHLFARAADIKVSGVSPDRVADYVESLLEGTGGLGRYDTFTHVDTRSGRPWRGDRRKRG